MRSPIIQNFRGYHALVVHPAGPTCDHLDRILLRLGLSVAHHDPHVDAVPLPEASYENADVVFFDADQGTGPLFSGVPEPALPLIAMIGLEAPGRLARAVALGACSYVSKPLRSSGIFTALFFAFNEAQRRNGEERRFREVEHKLHARRTVVKAILKVMELRSVDDDEAFRLIRKDSMRRRITIESFCQQLLEGLPEDKTCGHEERLRNQQ